MHSSSSALERAQVGVLAQAVQATGQSVQLAHSDQGHAGATPPEAAKKKGIELEMVKLAEAKRGFVLLPRR